MGDTARLSPAIMGRDFFFFKEHFELRQIKAFVLNLLNVRELGLVRFSSTSLVSGLEYSKNIAVSHLP